VHDRDVRAQCSTVPGGCGRFRNREAGRAPEPGLPVLMAVLAPVGRGRWLGQGVSLYRAAKSMMSVVAAIWMPPSTIKTPAPIAIARAVVSRDASSHTPKASRLMPAEQRALMRWAICGT